MANQYKCGNCGSKEFLINGWGVTEEVAEDPRIAGTYENGDIGKVDIVEVVCSDCGEHTKTVTGGLV